MKLKEFKKSILQKPISPLEKLQVDLATAMFRYRMKLGETPVKFAKRFGTTAKVIERIESQTT
jgi:hypothetical protein